MSKRALTYEPHIYKAITTLQSGADQLENGLVNYREYRTYRQKKFNEEWELQCPISVALYEQLSTTALQIQCLLELTQPRYTVELIHDVLMLVFSKCPLRTLIQARRVCKLWDNCASRFITTFCTRPSQTDEHFLSFLCHAGDKFINRKVLIVKGFYNQRFDLLHFLHKFILPSMTVDFSRMWFTKMLHHSVSVPLNNAVLILPLVRFVPFIFKEVRYVTCPNVLVPWTLIDTPRRLKVDISECLEPCLFFRGLWRCVMITHKHSAPPPDLPVVQRHEANIVYLDAAMTAYYESNEALRHSLSKVDVKLVTQDAEQRIAIFDE
jgi:hypothetical protein